VLSYVTRKAGAKRLRDSKSDRNLEREWGLGEAGDGDGLDVAYSCSAMAPRRSSMAICMRSRWVRNESTQMRIRKRPRTVVLVT